MKPRILFYLLLCLSLVISMTACKRSPAAAPTLDGQPDSPTSTTSGGSQEQPEQTQTPSKIGDQSKPSATKAPKGTTSPDASSTPDSMPTSTQIPTQPEGTVEPPTREPLPTATIEDTPTQPAGPELPTPTLTPEANPINLVDGMGRVISLPGPAVRIVSLSAANTELLFAIEAGPQVAGRDDLSDQPAEAQGLPSVGGSDGSYDIGRITEIGPDLVLLGGNNSVDQINAIDAAGFTYYYVRDPATLDEFYENIRSLGILTGQENTAENLVTSSQERVNVVISALSDVTERPIVFYEREASDINLPWTCGRGSILNELLFIAGATNAAEALNGDWVQMRLDDLTAINPDIIILGDTLYGVSPEDVLVRPGWENIKAVFDYMIIPFDDTLFSRPGPGLIEGLESLAASIHPDQFN